MPFENIGDQYPILKEVLENQEDYQVQIVYTQIDRDENLKPILKNFDFNLNEEKYFYPASTVKLPVAILALEWLNEQNIEGLTANVIMLTDSIRSSQTHVLSDSSAQNFLPSIAHYIKKILLVSDNDAYNRLYELLGQNYINQKLKKKGLNNTIINQRLSLAMSPEENRHFNPIRFLNTEGETILEIPARETISIYKNTGNPQLAEAYQSGGELISEPMDFTFKNRFSISDFHGVVQRIIFPELFAEKERFHISDSDREFILKYMSMYPGQSDYPAYDSNEFYDSYSKFYKFGTSKEPIPLSFKIYNKTGQAYGHLLDGSYFVDEKEGVEFFVTAVIYVNKNKALNDNQYEYDEIGFPFFEELGSYLYKLELERKKK
ncbi:hypothetical protein GCM10026987_18250 [Belliella aquatica]|uniref:beta-lactamase n=2 Tax=Belliella aquatica TaxID=1323734 RepID=A0ABQ1MRX2_9BACT|nr:hypothetical protein GCM10010993_23000 [Belliella aquatica]